MNGNDALGSRLRLFVTAIDLDFSRTESDCVLLATNVSHHIFDQMKEVTYSTAPVQ
jgi:hypothetical protein